MNSVSQLEGPGPESSHGKELKGPVETGAAGDGTFSHDAGRHWEF